jgi:hypothetical protein
MMKVGILIVSKMTLNLTRHSKMKMIKMTLDISTTLMALNKTTLNKTKLSKKTLGIQMLIITTLSIVTIIFIALDIMVLSIKTHSKIVLIRDTKHNGTQCDSNE